MLQPQFPLRMHVCGGRGVAYASGGGCSCWLWRIWLWQQPRLCLLWCLVRCCRNMALTAHGGVSEYDMGVDVATSLRLHLWSWLECGCVSGLNA